MVAMSTGPPGPWNTGAVREGDPIAVMRPGDAEQRPRAAGMERLAARAVDVHDVEPGEAAAGQRDAAGRRARTPGRLPPGARAASAEPGGAPQNSTFGAAASGVAM